MDLGFDMRRDIHMVLHLDSTSSGEGWKTGTKEEGDHPKKLRPRKRNTTWGEWRGVDCKSFYPSLFKPWFCSQGLLSISYSRVILIFGL